MFALALLLVTPTATAAGKLDIHVLEMNRPTTSEASLAMVDLRVAITNRGSAPVEIRRVDPGTPPTFLSKSELRESNRDPARAESLPERRTIAPGATEASRPDSCAST